MDLYDAARFEWASLRVANLDGAASGKAAVFNFDSVPSGWHWFEPRGEDLHSRTFELQPDGQEHDYKHKRMSW